MMDELARDPLLDALRGEPRPEPDWDALRGRVRAAAELPLARRAAGGRTGARRLRALVPLAAAACIAGVLWTARDRRPAPLTPAERSEIDAAVQDGLAPQVNLLLSGEAADAALLEAAGS